jgi:hypothetical protein
MSEILSERLRRTVETSAQDRAVSQFFNKVYAWMAVGLAVTALSAYLSSESAWLVSMIRGNPAIVVAFALGLFAISWLVGQAAEKISAAAATALFLVYATLMGVLCSYIFIVYEMQTIGAAFVMTAGIFAVLSIYGFVTKRDLTGIGGILVMCAFGLFAASLVNVFLASNMLSWIITYAVLAVFIGLTAYNTQKLKAIAHATAGNQDLANRYAIVGSLTLYVDFINIFLSLLRILGSRR